MLGHVVAQTEGIREIRQIGGGGSFDPRVYYRRVPIVIKICQSQIFAQFHLVKVVHCAADRRNAPLGCLPTVIYLQRNAQLLPSKNTHRKIGMHFYLVKVGPHILPTKQQISRSVFRSR